MAVTRGIREVSYFKRGIVLFQEHNINESFPFFSLVSHVHQIIGLSYVGNNLIYNLNKVFIITNIWASFQIQPLPFVTMLEADIGPRTAFISWHRQYQSVHLQSCIACVLPNSFWLWVALNNIEWLSYLQLSLIVKPTDFRYSWGVFP